MSVKTRLYLSTQPGAPTLSGTPGDLIAVLDACLVNGFGTATMSSLVVASGIATATFASGHSQIKNGVATVAGATPSGLNGDKRVLSISGSTFTYDATGISNQTATGTITAKVAAMGWTKLFAGTNKAVYKPNGAGATGFVLRVDDTGTTNGRVRGYEAMTDVDTGTGPFPTLVQVAGAGQYWQKSQTANSTTRAWKIICDDCGVYWGSAAGASICQFSYFGDIVSVKANDPYACVLHGQPGDQTGSYQFSDTACLGYSQATGSGLGYYVARPHNGLGGSYPMNCTAPAIGVAEYASGSTSQCPTPYPSPVDNGLTLVKPCLFNLVPGARGALPGLYFSPQQITAIINDQDQFPGAGDLAGKLLLACKFGHPTSAGNQGLMFFDILADWRP